MTDTQVLAVANQKGGVAKTTVASLGHPGVVLLEGDDDRILESAGRVLQRGIADLTILGDEFWVRLRAAELGVDLDEAAVIDPRTSELCDQFADQYAALRKNKGVTVEQADEIIHDDSYFGTMLVYNGLVDGMVSGAAHTAACTVRPAFEIIRTAPDVPRCPACS